MNRDREMELALEADGEKLRQLTGEDHGPRRFECQDCIGIEEHGCCCAAMGASQPGGPLPDDEPNTSPAPCPACFESSGFLGRVHHATWDEPAWEDADPTRRCEYCGGTGMVDCEPRTLDDIEEEEVLF